MLTDFDPEAFVVLAVEEDVLRFEVAVDDALVVQHLHRPHNLLQKISYLSRNNSNSHPLMKKKVKRVVSITS